MYLVMVINLLRVYFVYVLRVIKKKFLNREKILNIVIVIYVYLGQVYILDFFKGISFNDFYCFIFQNKLMINGMLVIFKIVNVIFIGK